MWRYARCSWGSESVAVAVCEAAAVVVDVEVVLTVEMAGALILFSVTQGRRPGRGCKGIELSERQGGSLDGTATDHSVQWP